MTNINDRGISRHQGCQLASWTLTDAEAMASAYPHRFYKPPQALIYQICPGDLVKLGFEVHNNSHCSGERMWVRVTSITPDAYEGTLQNIPAFLDDFALGQNIRFTSKNILDLDLHVDEKISILCEHGFFDADQCCEDEP